jgi:hypothetical protein
VAKRRRSARTSRPADRVPGSAREHWREDGTPKSRFADEDDANRASLRLRLEEGADLDPYRCSFCHGWHLGSRQA